jgi:hypothetical protein
MRDRQQRFVTKRRFLDKIEKLWTKMSVGDRPALAISGVIV